VSPATGHAAATAHVEATEHPLAGLAWLPDQKTLTITDVTKLKRLRRKQLSASTSHALYPDKCSVSMVIDRLMPREDGVFEANQLGTAAHAVLEHLFSLPGQERTKSRASAIAREYRTNFEFANEMLGHGLAPLVHALNEADTEKWFHEVDRRTHGLWEIEDPTQVTVFRNEMGFGAENEFNVNIGRVPFVGYIDRVDKIVDPVSGEIVGYKVIDYKMGKYKEPDPKFPNNPDEYGDQIKVYVAAMFGVTGFWPESGSLVFAKEHRERVIETTKEAVAGAVERFEAAYDRMHDMADKNEYPTKPGPLCGWCVLVNNCPAAVNPRTGNAYEDLSNTVKVPFEELTAEEQATGRNWPTWKKAKGVRKPGLDDDGNPLPLKAFPRGEVAFPVAQFPAPSDSDEANARRQPAGITNGAAQQTDTSAHRAPAPSTNTIEGNTPMTITAAAPAQKKLIEGVSVTDADVEGILNARSNSALAVTDLSAFTIAELAKAGMPITGGSVNALLDTFATIVQNVEFALTGATSYQSGANRLARTALKSVVESLPLPWGEDFAAWDAWFESARKRTSATLNAAIRLHSQGEALPDAPYQSLAGLAKPTAA
jgi:putative RecB family exonuclease